MKFGLFYLPTYLSQARDVQTHYRNMIEQIVYADKIGIDYVWMVEHHFVRHGGMLPSNFTFLSYLAAKTERIRLGTGAVVLPLNDPVRVAEQAATLDQLSKGRFDLGVGRGFLRDEFDAFGVDMKDSRERVEEGVDLIKKAWANPVLNYESKFRPRISNLSILPPVYQKPHPPIWTACFLTQESFEWTARE
ncbi:MAG: LLM class flavin-dependent oxidoreductase, partial [Alphaproteobacteria bacterium]